MQHKKALLVVDMQNDFCPGGALGVREGDKIIPAVNKYIGFFSRKKMPVFLSRDWHPRKTRHFKPFGGVWPVHCIKGTQGAEFHPRLKIPRRAIFLHKGMDTKKDSYSVFQAEDSAGMSFINLLKILGVRELYIAGLATDYCVKFTSIDALKKGFKVRVLIDAIKGVNLKPYDSQDALKKIRKMGVGVITLGRLVK